jgi:hypothetical protein
MSKKSSCLSPDRSYVASRRQLAKIVKITGLLILLGSGATDSIAGSLFGNDKDDSSWQEIAIQLPSAPDPANLVAFYVGPTTTQSFSIDAKSVTVGDDSVVRYTVVATSAAGAKNISYEGIRCKTLEKKLYATGHADGTWSRARRIEWEPIAENMPNRYHAALAKEYFCQDGGAIAGTAARLIENLRANRP